MGWRSEGVATAATGATHVTVFIFPSAAASPQAWMTTFIESGLIDFFRPSSDSV